MSLFSDYEAPEAFHSGQKIEALEREIRMRERVYPRRVKDNKMSAAKAEYEIKVLKAILTDYQNGRVRT